MIVYEYQHDKHLTKRKLPKQLKNNPEKFVISRILHLHLRHDYKQSL